MLYGDKRPGISLWQWWGLYEKGIHQAVLALFCVYAKDKTQEIASPHE
jgi:hypothetical protein